MLGSRGFALECNAEEMCRGARVHERHDAGDVDILGPYAAMDARHLEVIADGLPLFDGSQLVLRSTMVSPLHRDGTAKRVDFSQRLRSAPGGEAAHGRNAGGRARLVVLAAEVGSRWSEETAQFLRTFAKRRAQEAPRVRLRHWEMNLLACNAAKAFAISLLDRRPPLGDGGDAPSEHEVVCASVVLHEPGD